MAFTFVSTVKDVFPGYLPMADALSFLPKSRRSSAATWVRNLIESGKEPIRHQRISGSTQIYVSPDDVRKAVSFMVPLTVEAPAVGGVQYVGLAKTIKSVVPKKRQNACGVNARSLAVRDKIRWVKKDGLVFIHPDDRDAVVGKYCPEKQQQATSVNDRLDTISKRLEEAVGVFTKMIEVLQSKA